MNKNEDSDWNEYSVGTLKDKVIPKSSIPRCSKSESEEENVRARKGQKNLYISAYAIKLLWKFLDSFSTLPAALIFKIPSCFSGNRIIDVDSGSTARLQLDW